MEIWYLSSTVFAIIWMLLIRQQLDNNTLLMESSEGERGSTKSLFGDGLNTNSLLWTSSTLKPLYFASGEKYVIMHLHQDRRHAQKEHK